MLSPQDEDSPTVSQREEGPSASVVDGTGARSASPVSDPSAPPRGPNVAYLRGFEDAIKQAADLCHQRAVKMDYGGEIAERLERKILRLLDTSEPR